MDRDSTTFGQDPERLARLLGLAMEEDSDKEADPEVSKGELLRLRLVGTLPLETAVIDAIPAIAGRLCDALLPLRGKALGETLLDETTELAVLKRIKDYSKKLASREESEVGHAVSVTIYFSAIASALLYHDCRITSYNYSALGEAFETLTGKSWMPPELARHFAKAGKSCRRRAE